MTKRLTKAELIAEMTNFSALTQSQASLALDRLGDTIRAHLAQGNEVRIAGLGTFSVVHREARSGRNLHTGEAIEIAASKAVTFRPAAELRRAVNS